MDPTAALAEADKKTVTREADAATAAHWLAHPDTPARRRRMSDLIDQWESEPACTEEEPAL